MSNSDASSVSEGAEASVTPTSTCRRRLGPHLVAASCCAALILACLSIKSTLFLDVGSSRILSTMAHGRATKAVAPTCNDGSYSKHTLQLAYELPFAGLFNKYNRGQQKYEASGVIIVSEIRVCSSCCAKV